MSDSPAQKLYLILSRGQWDADKSKAEIQAAIDAFYLWHEAMVIAGRFGSGHRLAIEAKLVSSLGIMDGPFTESKEVIGGYWLAMADTLEEAAALAAQNPCIACGLAFEIRPVELERASAYRSSNEMRN
jgi:hypothetical protein